MATLTTTQILSIAADNAIRFRVDKPRHAPILAAIKRDVEIPNPEYHQAIRYGRSAYRIPETIRCYEWDRESGVLSLPRGYLNRFVAHAERLGYTVVFETMKSVAYPRRPVPSKIELRGYQIPAVEAMTAVEQGVLVAPPGAGKTEMALEILARIGQPVLWITHKQDLLVQVRDRAVARLGIKPNAIGIIGRGKETFGEWLTIGLVQTLRRRDLSQWADRWGAIMVDECHHVPATTFKEVVHQLPARYRFGLTGTPERADGLQPVMELYLGPIIYRIDQSVVQQSGGTITPRHKTIATGIRSAVWDRYEKVVAEWERVCEELALQGKGDRTPTKPMLPWNEIVDELLTNDARNDRIVNLLAQWAPGHSNLVLTSRVSHALELQQRLAQVAPSLRTTVIHHQMTLSDREAAVDGMRRGELDMMIAVDIPKEGLDIPRLDRLFFTAGGKDPIMVKQSIGRIQRIHPGKDDALVVDFVDFDVGIMRNHYFRRRKLYQELGMDVGGGKNLRQTA